MADTKSAQSQVRLRKALTLTDYFMPSLTGMIGSGWLFAALGAAGAMALRRYCPGL